MSEPVTLKAAAIELERRYATLQGYCKRGLIPATREGCHWLVEVEEAREAIARIDAADKERRRQLIVRARAARRAA